MPSHCAAVRWEPSFCAASVVGMGVVLGLLSRFLVTILAVWLCGSARTQCDNVDNVFCTPHSGWIERWTRRARTLAACLLDERESLRLPSSLRLCGLLAAGGASRSCGAVIVIGAARCGHAPSLTKPSEVPPVLTCLLVLCSFTLPTFDRENSTSHV